MTGKSRDFCYVISKINPKNLTKGQVLVKGSLFERRLELVISNTDQPLQTLSRKQNGDILLRKYSRNGKSLGLRSTRVQVQDSPNYIHSNYSLREAGL